MTWEQIYHPISQMETLSHQTASERQSWSFELRQFESRACTLDCYTVQNTVLLSILKLLHQKGKFYVYLTTIKNKKETHIHIQSNTMYSGCLRNTLRRLPPCWQNGGRDESDVTGCGGGGIKHRQMVVACYGLRLHSAHLRSILSSALRCLKRILALPVQHEGPIADRALCCQLPGPPPSSPSPVAWQLGGPSRQPPAVRELGLAQGPGGAWRAGCLIAPDRTNSVGPDTGLPRGRSGAASFFS